LTSHLALFKHGGSTEFRLAYQPVTQ
jgi:hypothetical protein